jgi:prophage regulatory protein
MQILRIEEALRRRGSTRSPHYDDVARGLFTKPIKVNGQRAAGYPEHEVEALIAARVAGATDEQVRRLVNKLHEQRKAGMPELA